MNTAARAPLNVVSASSAGEALGTLVLLHGMTDSAASWADAVAHWTAAGWQVVTVDARGHGTSPRWRPEELAARPGDVMAEDVAELVRALGGVALVGHSMGAGVAVAAATLVPGLVWAVVAEDPPWTLPPRSREPAVGLQWVREHEEQVGVPRASRVEQRRRAEPPWPASELEPWAEAKDQTDVALLVTGDIVPTTPWPDLLAQLRARGVPVLVVTGTRDVLVDDAVEGEARRLGAQVVRLPGAGHCVRRDAGPGYYANTDAFLAGQRPR
ncbi:MAG: alpha/beta fold hydrolase [Actinomycetes bacterium]